MAVNLAINNGGLFSKTQEGMDIYEQSSINEQTELAKAEDEIDKWLNGGVVETLVEYAQPGDKVNYGPVNGYSGEWRVLYNDGTNISIISMSAVKQVTLEGKDDYNNAVSILKTESEAYMNSFAESSRSVGSNPDGSDGRGSELLAFEDCPDFSYLQTFANDYKAADYAVSGASHIPYSNMDEFTLRKLGLLVVDEGFWLCMRAGYFLETGTHFGVGVFTSGVDYRYWMGLSVVHFEGYITDTAQIQGLRPVITLKSNVKVTGGNGTSGWNLAE